MNGLRENIETVGHLAALILTASTACAAVMDVGNELGPSGGYADQAYYQSMLGGQPMTAGQQAYADQEDQLRQLGFRAELGGDFALGQMFYRIAYGITPPPSALDLVGVGSWPWLFFHRAKRRPPWLFGRERCWLSAKRARLWLPFLPRQAASALALRT